MESSYYERAADRNGYFRVIKAEDDRVPAHFHNCTEIVAVTAGREEVVVNGIGRTLSRGEFAVSNSFDVHYYDSKEHSESFVLMLGAEYTARFRETFGGEFPNFVPKTERSEELIAILAKLKEAENANPLVVKGYVDVFLGTLTDVCPLRPPDGKGGNLAAKILVYLEEHLSEPLTLSSIAGEFGYHPNYFSALFRKYTGMGVKDYVNRLRAGRAALLSERGLKAGEVMRLAGFESPNTYYRAKKKWTKS